MYPKGGTTVPEIIGLGDCKKVLALGELTSEEPANVLERKCKVPYTLLPLPIGIDATDKFIMELSQLSNVEVPYLFNVTNFIRKGSNRIKLVAASTLFNMTGPLRVKDIETRDWVEPYTFVNNELQVEQYFLRPIGFESATLITTT